MNGFERRKEQKKESIRRAALELFSSYGFDRVSLNDIARRAHVSHVTIYNHFGSKDNLVQEVIRTVFTDLIEKSRAIIRGDQPFLEKLEYIVFNKAEVASQYQGQLMQMAIRDNSDARQFIESIWLTEVNQLIIELVEEGKRLGYIDEQLSQEALLLYFEILRQGAMASSDILTNIRVDGKLARDLNYLFLFGLVGKRDNKS